ncbi:iron ABC transporter permease [Paenibacillus sp. L3-i20]|uniref:FecCD family ABC transporter permease n=1 Tax=Paenibacillus sp. L3-i20 TaxID=2905833 RepID=UPI001EDE11D7|nr:iron ABC transporter permease [Paenibacillus sp. L3-i20]GKU78148.1 iron ABC transporter permease [Paenibacillus sp. L3-i20]
MFEHSNTRLWSVIAGSLLVTFIGAYLSLTNGMFDISVPEIVRTLLRIDSNKEHVLVVYQFRLPRIVLAALVGSALGMAGAVIQGVTRNGLADPGILGINAGAGMVVVLFMFLFQGQLKLSGWAAVMMMPMFGLAGGLLATVLIYLFAKDQGKLDPQRLLLVGIAVASGFGAVTLYVSLKMNPNDFEMATVWLAGSIYNANWKFVATMLPWLLILPPILWWKAKSLDLFQLGEHSATGLGVSVERVKKQMLLCSIGLVSASVAVSGSIGFVGLIAPHIARRLVGLRHRSILPVSGLIGAAMVVFGDFIGKTIFAPAELAVGIVISIIGVPYFVWLLIRSKK